VILWNRPEAVPITEAEEEAFEQDHGVAMRTGGSRTLALWGMGLSLLVAGIVFATLLLSYFYLRVENDTWPPPGVSAPPMGWVAISTAVVLVAAVGNRYALLAASRDDAAALRNRLLFAIVLSSTATATQVVDFARLPFDATTHAYGSIFYTLGGFVIVMTLIGVVINAVVAYQASRARFTARRHAPVLNAARFATAAASTWTVGAAVLYLAPRLT
jgi:cytochrome c oxidase subunit I+III